MSLICRCHFTCKAYTLSPDKTKAAKILTSIQRELSFENTFPEPLSAVIRTKFTELEGNTFGSSSIKSSPSRLVWQ